MASGYESEVLFNFSPEGHGDNYILKTKISYTYLPIPIHKVKGRRKRVSLVSLLRKSVRTMMFQGGTSYDEDFVPAKCHKVRRYQDHTCNVVAGRNMMIG